MKRRPKTNPEGARYSLPKASRVTSARLPARSQKDVRMAPILKLRFGSLVRILLRLDTRSVGRGAGPVNRMSKLSASSSGKSGRLSEENKWPTDLHMWQETNITTENSRIGFRLQRKCFSVPPSSLAADRRTCACASNVPASYL